MRVLGPRAREKGIELSWHVDSRVPALLVGDSGRLRQILLNLVGNAVKFTGKGGIIVESELAEQLEDRVILHLRITDTGIGIPRDRQEAIFEAFTQVDGSTTRQFGGTGLGLTICSQLVAAMGGKIWVESEQGSGSTFHFTARFGIGAAPSNRVDSRSPLAGKTLLVVDPEEETRRLLREMLAAQGALALPAEGVSEAVAVACQRASLDSGLDAVLISDHTCSTPEELVAEIRLILGCAEIPALLLQTEDEGEVPSIFSGAVSRPVVESELAERLRELLEASPRKAPWGDCKAPLDILLAEDNLVNRKLAVRLLERLGHTVTVAINGIDALDKLESHGFDLVLMDIQMPVLDGLEATREQRAREERSGGHVPIVAMTAHAMRGDRERCLRAGMDDYLSKPIRTDELRRILDRHAPAANGNGHPEGGSDPSPPLTEGPSSTPEEAV
jgi:CheY-like chemotaxis protein